MTMISFFVRTSVTGRVKEGLKETGKDLKSLLKKNKDEY